MHSSASESDLAYLPLPVLCLFFSNSHRETFVRGSEWQLNQFGLGHFQILSRSLLFENSNAFPGRSFWRRNWNLRQSDPTILVIYLTNGCIYRSRQPSRRVAQV